MRDDEWDDLKEAIEILSKHKTGSFPFHCEHDELFVMSNPDDYTSEELSHLDKLGFFPNAYDGFTSYRYGSA